MTDTTKPGPWIGWNGGECPEHPETIAEARLECGSILRKKAADLMWERVGSRLDIIVYRVLKEHKDPREWWVHPSVNDVSSSPAVGYIHVREVKQ